jgi:DNA repair protein RecO (recombination protein O)
MSTIVKTEAVVLKAMKYRGTSMIVTFYTRHFGKIAGIVKGARQTKNKFGSSLQLMSHVMLVFYKKEGRDLQTVTQCDMIKSFRNLSEDIEKMAVGMSMIELVANIAHEEEENAPLFSLLSESLSTVNDATKNPSNVFYYFELKLASLLGFEPRFDECLECRSSLLRTNNKGEIVAYHLGRGGPLCANCSNVPGKLRKLTVRSLAILKSLDECEAIEQVFDFDIDYHAKEEINGFLWDYLRHHISGMRALKSTKVFSQILDAS